VLDRGQRCSVVRAGHREEYHPARSAPGDSWTDHLVFALKRESLSLEVLAVLFAAVPIDELTDFVRRSPNGRYARLAWFLFEWLTATTLPLPGLTQGNYFPVLDGEQHLAIRAPDEAVRVRRQRILNNLPGTPAYCPLVRRTAVPEASTRRTTWGRTSGRNARSCTTCRPSRRTCGRSWPVGTSAVAVRRPKASIRWWPQPS